MLNPPYLIITPAFNEGAYIEATIESVLRQSVLPVRWIIVDDGSTDQTARKIRHYEAKYSWIQYIYRQKEPGQTYYASNVYAIQAGLRQAETVPYDYLAILDADISLPPDYYEKVLGRMEKDRSLGIASGVYIDNVHGKIRKVLQDCRSTPKALMVFRRSCYTDIGGLMPMKYGGEDTCACFMARQKGWKTWSFPDLVATHNRPVGMGQASTFMTVRFRQGIGEYFLATHPLFLILKALRRCILEPPYVIGGLCRLFGFLYAHGMREKRQIPEDLIRFIRKEQFQRVLTGNKIPSEFTFKGEAE